MAETTVKAPLEDGLDELYELIDRGRSGLNIGISTQITKLDNTIAGVQRSTQFLIAGDTGFFQKIIWLMGRTFRRNTCT